MGGWCSRRHIILAEPPVPESDQLFLPIPPCPNPNHMTKHHFFNTETQEWQPSTPFTPIDKMVPSTDLTRRRSAEHAEALNMLADVND